MFGVLCSGVVINLLQIVVICSSLEFFELNVSRRIFSHLSFLSTGNFYTSCQGSVLSLVMKGFTLALLYLSRFVAGCSLIIYFHRQQARLCCVVSGQ